MDTSKGLCTGTEGTRSVYILPQALIHVNLLQTLIMEGIPVKDQFGFIQLLSTHGDQDGKLAVKVPTDDRAVQEGANHLNQLEEPGQIRRKMTQTHHSY